MSTVEISAKDVKALGCVDEVIDEPRGGTQADPPRAFALVAAALSRHYAELKTMPLDQMLTEMNASRLLPAR